MGIPAATTLITSGLTNCQLLHPTWTGGMAVGLTEFQTMLADKYLWRLEWLQRYLKLPVLQIGTCR
jgi:hypothetical protein